MGDFGGYGGFEHMPSGGYGQMGQMGQMGRMSRWNGKVFSVRDAPIKKTGIMWEFFQNSGGGFSQIPLIFFDCFFTGEYATNGQKNGQIGRKFPHGGRNGVNSHMFPFFLFFFFG